MHDSRAVSALTRCVAWLVLVLAGGAGALAFHSGGVGDCTGCHSMHASFPTGSSLLIANDPSAACLSCHQQAAAGGPASFHVSTPQSELVVGVSPIQRTPGGDFGWLHKTYTWLGRGGVTEIEEGHRHGHNVIATAGLDETGGATNYGYDIDPIHGTSPGGTFPSTALGCQSCHDPHGQSRRNLDGSITGPAEGAAIVSSGSYDTSVSPAADQSVGVYRLLAGPGYTTGGVTFLGAPDAVAPSGYNQSEAANQVKVAYGRATASGHVSWSTWCATCHGAMHWDGGTHLVHPTDEILGAAIANNYNLYVRTGDLSGTESTSYTSLVPFVYGHADYDSAGTGLRAQAGSTSPTYPGPTGTDRVDCLSCHRAHASGWRFALRWNPDYEFITDLDGNYFNGGAAARGRTAAEVEDAYYDRPPTVFSRAQRSLCNKCHIMD